MIMGGRVRRELAHPFLSDPRRRLEAVDNPELDAAVRRHPAGKRRAARAGNPGQTGHDAHVTPVTTGRHADDRPDSRSTAPEPLHLAPGVPTFSDTTSSTYTGVVLHILWNTAPTACGEPGPEGAEHALPVLPSRRLPGRRLPRGERGRRDPPPPVLPASAASGSPRSRRPACPWSSATASPSRSAGPRSSAASARPARAGRSTRTPSRCWRSGSRRPSAPRGAAEVAAHEVGLAILEPAAGARRGRLPALRQRLPLLRVPRRLRGRDHRAARQPAAARARPAGPAAAADQHRTAAPPRRRRPRTMPHDRQTLTNDDGRRNGMTETVSGARQAGSAATGQRLRIERVYTTPACTPTTR